MSWGPVTATDSADSIEAALAAGNASSVGVTDHLLDRITYVPEATHLEPIPWPTGLAPKPIRIDRAPTSTLPKADVLVTAYTEAEGQALADVLSPGHPLSDWQSYARDFGSYINQLTDRSPARDSHNLGSYALTQIGAKTVCLFKHALHPATDGPSLPIRQLWRQIITEAEPELVITHGTAGGCEGLELGDVAVATDFTWNCQRQFKDESWAHESFSAPAFTPGSHLSGTVPSLLAVNAGALRQYADRDPQVVLGRSVESVDFFGFYDTPSDSYGIMRADPTAATEEMDDCALPMAIGDLGPSAPPYLSVRNASDPPVPDSIGDLEAQSKWAEEIYRRLGYVTTVGSSIVCWAIIADL
jgi:hypothetical protein